MLANVSDTEDSRLFDRVSLRTEPDHVASTIGRSMTGGAVD
ncbi:hypothetical protein MA4S0726RB_3602 [Mycobacteroides abscessus 4S-0726-RB]|nr:hypothetical protein MA4S0303_4076 [Mycobacteroides abscessus 4S-0303]EIT92267.1 hypothetical protein MA4S0726RB_3602 [Mycobacteroides abscessus 4S-0726-RB]EIT95817.1 hypothetical protein MA4S0726RA_4013 [Mycobacteroides abscessus 4S-0726-RA]EIV08766.1 hypothetical protein MA4S0206_4089 [Mycobacteroides abscessus 4S-0206]EIV48123.1 hypothetical protein MA4S0116R_4046 [Mycobacteroides abscessus 4S-0116-R]EIV60249.1 hypothetical protein MA4S0116S_3150 [Mycobacteroides abscessus 4S-0116-S]